MPKQLRKPGEFCWINILTPQTAAARDFFGTLLGWSFSDMGGMGSLIQVNGSDVGGLFDVVSPRTPQGTPPVVGVMVKVENADATVERVKALGGQAQPAFDIMDRGRMAVCHDPNGANFDIWEAKTSLGTDVDATVHGAPSWFENLTTDAARGSKFYADLFGWQPQAMPMGDFTYTAFNGPSGPVAGLMPIQEFMGPMPPNWGTYFTVDNVDDTLAKAEKLGGTIAIPAQDIPNIGRFGGIVSPQGVMFSVIAYLPQTAQ